MRLTKVSLLILALTASLFFGCTRSSSAPQPATTAQLQTDGNEGGNGGDTLSAADESAWFLSSDPNRELRVCIAVSEKFGLDPVIASQELSRAFAAWGDYITKHKIQLDIEGARFVPVTKIHEVDCDQDYDLKFYFGTTSREVQLAQAQFHNPLGFAVRTKYDVAAGWGHGFIWIANAGTLDSSNGFPRWREVMGSQIVNTETLQGILLHEIGHLLGCGHVNGTIMRADIVDYLEHPTRHNGPWNLTNIEQEQMLVLDDRFANLADRYVFGYSIDPESTSEGDTLLKLLFGAEVQYANKLNATLLHEAKNPNIYHIFYGLGDHQFFANRSTQDSNLLQVEVGVNPQSLNSAPDSRAFKMSVGSFFKDYDGGQSQVLTGSAHIQGHTYSSLIQFNGQGSKSPISIYILSGDNRLLIY